MLKLKVEQTEFFRKQIKELKKKYRLIDNDIDLFLNHIDSISDLGMSLGKNLYKARIRNSTAGKGKSGGSD